MIGVMHAGFSLISLNFGANEKTSTPRPPLNRGVCAAAVCFTVHGRSAEDGGFANGWSYCELEDDECEFDCRTEASRNLTWIMPPPPIFCMVLNILT